MKIALLQFSIFIFLSITAAAQDAPDFTVTDARGNVHTLYEDYLDNGKTVLLKIFHTACPPCNQIAPFIEELYQEWGAGNHQVEFIELSTQSFDDNTRINSYTTQHGITFPSAGAQGGSLEANAPYLDGDFGIFTGTPTFVVIAPDGAVNFDVSGLGTQGQIDALDEALEETGASKHTTSAKSGLDAGSNNLVVTPNPFQTETQIEISTRTGGMITLEVFDILGNRISTLENEVSHAGLYSFSEDFEGIRSGTYILRASLDGYPIKSLKVVKRGS